MNKEGRQSVASKARPSRPPRTKARYTSNIVGPIFEIADLMCFAVSIPLAIIAYALIFGQKINVSTHVFALTLMVGTFFLLRSSKRVYRMTLTNFVNDEGEVSFDALISSLIASALVWQLGMIENYSRGLSLLYLLAVVACLWISRPIVRRTLERLAKNGSIQQRIAFYGSDQASVDTIRRLLSSLQLRHVRFVGVADDRPTKNDFGDLPLLGGYDELAALARRGEIDQVLITVPNIPRERLHEIVEGLSAVSVDVSFIPAQAIDLAPDYRVNLLGTVPVLTLWQRPFRDVNQFVKRAEDLVLTGVALVFFAPVLGITALLIRMTSPGPVLFVQPRIGFNNETIHVFKFRTMYHDRADLLGAATTTRHDPRVTPVGRILRKLSIDELPQLLNVLRGDMSLIGPRPHAIEMKVGDRFYQDAVRGYAGRHRVKPGITGLAQVNGLRGEIRTMERAKQRVEFDKQYIDRWSLWLDMWILLATAKAVLFDADAY